MKSQVQFCQQILQSLIQAGVQEFVVCAGARNAALVMSLLRAQAPIRIYSHFEERSAAFFALGRARSMRAPVAVVTTSGTAAAELLPAMIEAHYVGASLLAVTADRPRSYRGSGAPQSIVQNQLFLNHCHKSWDLEEGDSLPAREGWGLEHGPVHLNICLQEPRFSTEDFPEWTVESLQTSEPSLSHGKTSAGEVSAFGDMPRPLIVVGPLEKCDQDVVVDFLEKQTGPIYLETLSGLRGHPSLIACNLLTSAEVHQGLFVNSGSEAVFCSSLLRIGGVPTLRLWRDLEESLSHVPVLSVSNLDFSGLARSSLHLSEMNCLSGVQTDLWKNQDRNQDQTMSQSLSRKPFASEWEAKLVGDLAKNLEENSLYLGNSLPVREWDATDPRLLYKDVMGQRGVNGIDGQVSSYLGWSEDRTESFAVLGDLTSLYDLQALWLTPQLKKNKRRILIVNNGGGQIFKTLFDHPSFINSHALQFENWAKMFSWDYLRLNQVPSDFLNKISGYENLVIEFQSLPGES